jgi:hypothetical protein
MAIKTTGTEFDLRIITKTIDGQTRVSCECCEEPIPCCVFPAECGIGPQFVSFYGTALEETAPNSLIYGDTQNGVELFGGQWKIYRNGNVSTQSCLGMNHQLQGPRAQVTALLPTTFAISVTTEFGAGGGSLALQPDTMPLGTPCDDDPGGSLVNCGYLNQCSWNSGLGDFEMSNQDFDEGIVIFFNKDRCRWELWTGPINGFYGYLPSESQQSPVGSYEIADPNITMTVS